MPRTTVGQQITLETVRAPAFQYTQYTFIRAQRGDTCTKIASRRKHPDLARQILKLNPNVRDIHGNKLRHVYQKIKHGTRIRLPGILTPGNVVNVLCDDPPPIVTDGYAIYESVALPGRRYYNKFDGYDPVSINIPVQWDAFASHDTAAVSQIESDIAAIERMAGIGNFKGARIGAPCVIAIRVTDNHGNTVPLVPPYYQQQLTYRVNGIAWDANPIRTSHPTTQTGQDPGGKRIRQKAVITVTEFTPVITVSRSATTRAKTKPKPKHKKTKVKH